MANSSALQSYISKVGVDGVTPEAAAFWANMDLIAKVEPSVRDGIISELKDQRSSLKLIASENYSSLSVQSAMANLLTDKYAEGASGARFYAGCENVDEIESTASELACQLFGCDHAYVQPHSGSDANLVAFWAILRERVQLPALAQYQSKNPLDLNSAQWAEVRAELNNQKLFAMDMFSGGHLTHGYRFNMSAQLFDVHQYTVSKETNLLDYDSLWAQLKEIRPLVFLVGYSSYPRKIDFAKMRQMADDVGAVLMVDMAHFAGLVAGGVFEGDANPVPYADVLTSTTHKTLRGPRGGIVLSKKEFAESVDKGCPMVMGGPLPHVIAAKAVAFREALSDGYKDYVKQVVDNASALAEGLKSNDMPVVTDGTDNHLVVANISSLGLTGRQCEGALRECGITANRNVVPFDENGPWFTSGLRFGTPSLTTLGMKQGEMKEIANLINEALRRTGQGKIASGPNAGKPSRGAFVLAPETQEKVSSDVRALLSKFMLYPEIDLDVVDGA